MINKLKEKDNKDFSEDYKVFENPKDIIEFIKNNEKLSNEQRNNAKNTYKNYKDTGGYGPIEYKYNNKHKTFKITHSVDDNNAKSYVIKDRLKQEYDRLRETEDIIKHFKNILKSRNESFNENFSEYTKIKRKKEKIKRDLKKQISNQTKTIVIAGATGAATGAISDSITGSLRYGAKFALKNFKKYNRLIRI